MHLPHWNYVQILWNVNALTHARPHRLRSKKGPLFRSKLCEDIISDAIGRAGREER